MSENQGLLNRLEELLRQKRGKKFYAEKLEISEEEVNELLKELRNIEEPEIINTVSEKNKNLEILNSIRKVNTEKGTIESVITTNHDPKDDIELAKLHKVNLEKYVITNYWSKMLPSGKFTSSVFSKLISSEDILKQDLTEDIKNIFFNAKIEKFEKIKNQNNDKKALFVYLADDHAGIDYKDSLFNSPYNGEIYFNRLNIVADNILNLKETFEHIFIINLGDELDGFNKQTTRGGHALDSLSNKEQFNIYVKARKHFYDSILTSNKFDKATIITINNGNHSGNDYSYIVNKSLEFYIEARYEFVSFINQDKFIASYAYGNHVFLMTHGKDEKYMKFGFPLNLNEKTDLWLMDYSKNVQGKYLSTMKGDLHSYSVNMGKSGRYVNVPSICGGSNWIEHNYGSSSPGALLEIVEKNNKNIVSIPVWF